MNKNICSILGKIFGITTDKNDFEIMCDEMNRENANREKYCSDNPIIRAKCLVEKYVQGDTNRLLKLKAEASGITYYSFVLGLFSILSMAVSICASVVSIFDENPKVVVVVSFVVVICVVITRKGMKAFSAVNQYGDYITVAIAEIEKEYNRE